LATPTPSQVASEGKLLALVAPEDSERVLSAVCQHPLGTEAAVIGEVVDDRPGLVTMKTRVGSTRVGSMLSGDQLPRIC